MQNNSCIRNPDCQKVHNYFSGASTDEFTMAIFCIAGSNKYVKNEKCDLTIYKNIFLITFRIL